MLRQVTTKSWDSVVPCTLIAFIDLSPGALANGPTRFQPVTRVRAPGATVHRAGVAVAATAGRSTGRGRAVRRPPSPCHVGVREALPLPAGRTPATRSWD